MEFENKEQVAVFIERHLKELGGEAYGLPYIAEKLWQWHEQQVKSVDLANVGGSLPTNGEIEAYAMYQCGGCSPESCDERAGIIAGAKWMRQKLIKLLKQ